MDSKALQKISYGMYVVTSGKEAKCNGQIANTVIQVTSRPETVAVSINKQNYTHELIKKTLVFAVSILSKNTPLKFIGTLASIVEETWTNLKASTSKSGKLGHA